MNRFLSYFKKKIIFIAKKFLLKISYFNKVWSDLQTYSQENFFYFYIGSKVNLSITYRFIAKKLIRNFIPYKV